MMNRKTLDRRGKIQEYKIVKEYCKLMCNLWLENNKLITTRATSIFPELHWMFRHVQEYRASLKLVEKTGYYVKFQPQIEAEFKQLLPGRYWNHKVQIDVGPKIFFRNDKKRYPGEHRKANITLVLRPSYIKNVIEGIGRGNIDNKFILNANRIKINNDNIEIFEIQYANIYDDTEISHGYLSMTNNKQFYKMKPTFGEAVKAGQSSIKSYVKETIKNSTD